MGAPASTTLYGEFGPFELQVSRGQIAGHRMVAFNGYNLDVDTTWENFWPHGGLLTFPAAALQMSVSSSSALDTAAGTGARSVTIQGLDTDYNEITETVTLNGQTAVLTTQLFLRINGISLTSAGAGLTNAGTLYFGTGVVTAGVPATVYDVIAIGDSMRQTHCYTVPAGHTAYVVGSRFTLAQTSGTELVQVRLTQTNTDNIKRAFAVAALNNGALILPLGAPLAASEKTRIAGEAKGNANDNVCASFVQLIVIKNEIT